ncbi:hypothetical protein ASE70_07955 [Sphingomonas sp. Leaf22]|uniref:hypothetical protein n=1 Tax=Sphingomonas sp. Leaf22 TaxID=1735687 RepID=UPI0006FE0C76|nr:hypothetical protein [Sphingomonas sp. Leaf22]KQM76695.1 hypothetical protein ASE70_07955 [Sphingomonas sp. Leaf22]
MTDTTPSPAPRWLAWMPAASVGALIAGSLLTGGGYIQRLDEQVRRITVLEESIKQLQEIDKRTTRIEAKLDVLVPQQDRETRR